MSHRFVRLMATAVVVAGAAFFASPEVASASASSACGQVYCRSGDCPGEQYLLVFCESIGCAGGSIGCMSGFDTTCGGGAAIVCFGDQT